MTLQEAMSAKKLLRLEPFLGFKPCGKLTGKYYYDGLNGDHERDKIMVEIREWLFVKRYVPLSMLREVREVEQ